MPSVTKRKAAASNAVAKDYSALMKNRFLRPAAPTRLAVSTQVQIEHVRRLPRKATIYAIKELVRRAGVTADLFQTWRIEFDDQGFVNVFIQPSTSQKIRFPQANLWFWRELNAGQFRTSTAKWMCDPGTKAVLIPDFKIPFSSDVRRDVGSLFAAAGRDCLECTVDLPTSVLLTLSRFEETLPGPRDVHGRFSAFSSIAWQNGFLHRPIVDEYGLALEQALSILLPRWKPAERRLRVKLGHDVDEIGLPFSLRTVLGHTFRRKLPLGTLRDLVAPWTGIDTTYAILLRKLVNLSFEHGLDAAVYWKASAPRAQEAGYDIRDKRIRSLVAGFHAKGIEMGVHPSYDTFESLERLQMEVSAVRELLGDHEIGGRQDFLRWNPETWVHWDELGLAYDATVGFADHIGFRAGTSYPYRPWLLSKGREAQLLEIPLMAMDSTPQGYMKLSPEDAFRELLDCVARCRTVGGVFSLLWHNTRLIGRGYPVVYRKLLHKLAGGERYDWRQSCDRRFWS